MKILELQKNENCGKNYRTVKLQFFTIVVTLLVLFSTNAFATDYPIYVGGVQVTDANKDDVLDDRGHVWYDDDTKTLVLDNAVIERGSHPVYTNVISFGDEQGEILNEHYTVFLIGRNVARGFSKGIRTHVDTLTISGSGGSLTIYSDDAGTIKGGNYFFFESEQVNIKDCILYFDYMSGGDEMNGPSGDLIIERATISAKGGVSGGTIADFESINLIDCDVYEMDIYWENGSMVYHSDTEAYTGEININPNTIDEVIVGGIHVCEGNKEDVLEDGGSVSYNPTTHTLTLNNAIISNESEQNNAILLGLQASNLVYTIELIGNNRIFNSNYGIWSESTLVVKGSGSLDIDVRDTGFTIHYSTLTIKDCSLKVFAAKYGITGEEGDMEYLVINNAEVRATGQDKESIGSFISITLENCRIESPVNADYSSGTVMINGETCKEEVVIKRGVSDISPLMDDMSENNVWTTTGNINIEYNYLKEAKAYIYSLQGHRVATMNLYQGLNSQSMDKGIYIVRIGNKSYKVNVK